MSEPNPYEAPPEVRRPRPWSGGPTIGDIMLYFFIGTLVYVLLTL